MAPAKSDQNGSNQPAAPRQDQTNQGPTPWANYTEQVEQPMEQEVVMAIVRPGDSTITISDQMRADFEKGVRLAQRQPLPDGNDDDFADEPLPRPYDPESATGPEWAKSEVWIQEKDSEGRTLWRNQLTAFVRYSRPEGFLDHDGNRSTAERHDNPEPRDHESEGIVRK